VAVHRGYGAGILATLAYVAVVVVSRLPLRAAWGQSRLAAQDVSEPRDRVFPVRPLARRELELRDLGSVSRNVPGTGAPRPGCGSAAALVAVSSRLSAARRDDRMGVLPGRYAADRDGVFAHDVRLARSGRSHAVHPDVLPDAGSHT